MPEININNLRGIARILFDKVTSGAGQESFFELKNLQAWAVDVKTRIHFVDAIETIVQQLPGFRRQSENMRDILLSDLVMIGEIPSPTFGEEARIRFIVNRFCELGLQSCSIDEKGNGTGMIPGSEGERTIVLVAHADTFVANTRDQTIEVTTDRLIGPFVGDNSIALAALTTLPVLLEKLGLKLKSNVLLLASTRVLGRGNLEGTRFFVANSSVPIHAGLCLESVQLGRLNYTCIGMFRAEIHCRLPKDYNWAHFGTTGSIIPMSDVVNRISRIPLSRRPLSTIVMGSINGGLTYNNIARETVLKIEVRSESSESLNQIKQQIEDVVQEVSAQSGTQVTLDVFTRREPGGIDIAHPLVRNAKSIITALGLQPMIYPTTSQLAALRDAGIPSLTLGLTTGERRNELDEIDEAVAVAPLFSGMAQLVGMLLSMDEGVGNANRPMV